MNEVRYFHAPDGERLAHLLCEGGGPAFVFLPGYKSDMSGSKAQAVLEFARDQRRGCLLLDYSGCGLSSGDFAGGTLSKWRDEVLALIDHAGFDKVVLIGSSMGGWLMLLLAAALGNRAAALVGIAAAPDFTDWGTSDQDKARLAAGETVFDDNPYGPEPTPTHPGFWTDGQALRQLSSEVPFTGSVRLLHGQADADVPWDISLRLAATLRSADVQVTLIKDGDHRLSREGDIDLLLRTLAALPPEPSR